MKAKLEQLIDSWVICMGDKGLLQLAPAIDIILKSIESELQEYKVQLAEKEDVFQTFIHAALYKVQSLPKALRMQSLSYLNGGIQRVVPRPEYQRLKQCFIPYLKPIPWSSYSVFIAREVLPASLLILIVASLPGLALAASKTHRLSSENTALDCRHNLNIDHSQNRVMLTHVKQQLTKMGVDYGTLFNQADFNLEETRHHADCLAYNLTQFGAGKLALAEEKEWLKGIANDDTFMEPLHQILLYAQNKPLLYKIIAKLSQVLYEEIQSSKALNTNKLMNILGRAIMIIRPDALPASVTAEEISKMRDILLLYRSIAEDKPAVNQQRALLQAQRRPTSSTTSEMAYPYYGVILAAFVGMMGLAQFFMRFLKRASIEDQVIEPVRRGPKSKVSANDPVFSEKSPIHCGGNSRSVLVAQFPNTNQMANRKAALSERMSTPKDLNAILSQLDDLFSHLIVPDPLCWHNAANDHVFLDLTPEQYCFNTQGDGKAFWLTRTALSALLTSYCKDHLEIKEEFIRYIAHAFSLLQPLAIELSDNTRPVKQYYSAFLKPLKKLANLYNPMNIKLDFQEGKFIIVFNLAEESYHKIGPYPLTAKKFLQCVHCSLHLENQNEIFSIPLEVIQSIVLPNEKEFARIKEAAYLAKRSEFQGQAAFFHLPANDERINRRTVQFRESSELQPLNF